MSCDPDKSGTHGIASEVQKISSMGHCSPSNYGDECSLLNVFLFILSVHFITLYWMANNDPWAVS